MCDSRFTECPTCDGEGRILRRGTNIWDVIDHGECPTCKGSGVAEIEVEPITMEPCPNCDGQGWIASVRPACCGNLTPSGSCRGSCCVPEQYQEQCPACTPQPKPEPAKDELIF